MSADLLDEPRMTLIRLDQEHTELRLHRKVTTERGLRVLRQIRRVLRDIARGHGEPGEDDRDTHLRLLEARIQRSLQLLLGGI